MNQDETLYQQVDTIQQMRDDYAKRFAALRSCIARLPDNRHKTDLVANFRKFFDHVVQNIDRKETDIATCLSDINNRIERINWLESELSIMRKLYELKTDKPAPTVLRSVMINSKTPLILHA